MTSTLTNSTTLENGDRLSLDEFNRRYSARPDLRHVELIEGVVHLPFPTRITFHADPHGLLVAWLAAYCSKVIGVRVAIGGTIRLSEDSQVEPDAFLYRTGGVSGMRITDQGYGDGPPEVVGEIAASSASYDLHSKLRVYEQAGVPEYIVWRTEDAVVDWFRLIEGRYVRIEPDANGMIESSVFPGLRLSIPALLSGDYAAVLRSLGG